MDTIYQKQENLVTRKIAGETLVVPISGDLANMQRIFTLDSVSESIWRQIDGKQDLEKICDRLLSTFDVEKEEAERDLKAFIAELREAGLIHEV
jgi:hypothetical protein